MTDSTSTTAKPAKKKMSLTKKIVLIETALLALGALLFTIYWTASSNSRQRVEAQLETLNTLDAEISQCTQLIQQREGNFDQFQYCRQLLSLFGE